MLYNKLYILSFIHITTAFLTKRSVTWSIKTKPNRCNHISGLTMEKLLPSCPTEYQWQKKFMETRTMLDHILAAPIKYQMKTSNTFTIHYHETQISPLVLLQRTTNIRCYVDIMPISIQRQLL